MKKIKRTVWSPFSCWFIGSVSPNSPYTDHIPGERLTLAPRVKGGNIPFQGWRPPFEDDREANPLCYVADLNFKSLSHPTVKEFNQAMHPSLQPKDSEKKMIWKMGSFRSRTWGVQRVMLRFSGTTYSAMETHSLPGPVWGTETCAGLWLGEKPEGWFSPSRGMRGGLQRMEPLRQPEGSCGERESILRCRPLPICVTPGFKKTKTVECLNG